MTDYELLKWHNIGELFDVSTQITLYKEPSKTHNKTPPLELALGYNYKCLRLLTSFKE